MAQEIIAPHTFEVAKDKIHSLSKSVPNVSLQEFQTEGSIISWNDHKVTGDEVNTLLVSPLQSTLIDINKTIRSLFDIADEVYKALESLDKEYIQGIIVAVKSAETASDQAKEASSQALDASKKAIQAQADIKETIEALRVTVNRLKEFKEQATAELSSISTLKTEMTSANNRITAVDNKIADVADAAKEVKSIRPYFSNLTHIKDVDRMWSDLKSARENVQKLTSTLTPFISRVNQITTRIDGDIAALKQYRALLESYKHLGDVDAIWSDVEGHKTDLASLHQQVEAFVEKVHQAGIRMDGDIESLKQYRALFESYKHLGDVDVIWSDVEGHKTDLASLHQQVEAFVEKVHQADIRMDGDIEALKQYRTLLESYKHLGDVDAIWSDVEGHKTDLLDLKDKLNAFIKEAHSELERVNGLIHQMEESNNLVRLQYDKKLRTAYWIGGSAVGLSVINYILQIVGVL